MESVEELVKKAGPSPTPAILTDTSGAPTSPYELGECTKCEGTGWRHSGNLVSPCPCRRERSIRASVPKRYHTACLEDFPDQLVQRVRKWLEQPGDGLFLCGPSGTGKTHMAAAIVRFRLETGDAALFKRTSELYSAIRKSFHAANTGEEDVMREYVQTPLLVLDDLGAGSLSDHERRCTLELLDQRLDAVRPTFVTSNWTIEEIAERMDVRLASRLSGFVVMAITGKDRRAVRTI